MSYRSNISRNLWGHVQLYNLYRLIVAGVLALMSLSDRAFIQASIIDNNTVNMVIAAYTVIVIFSNIICYAEWPSYTKQIYLGSIIDISVLLIIIHASGGINFGIGVLLILPVLIPNLLRPSRFSLLLTIFTVVGLLGIEANKQLPSLDQINNLFHTGVLSFFIILASWLSTKWSTSASQTAELAKKQGLDLANLSELNQAIIDQLPTGIIVTEDGSTIRHMNSFASEIIGKPEKWRNQNISQFAPELATKLTEWHTHVKPRSASYDLKHRDITELRSRFVQLGPVSSGASIIYLEDTHEEREQLQGMKLASLGQLTANIAHEIRNPLGAISHAAQLLSESEKLDQADTRLMQIIQSNSKRMNLTIESVLNLSRRKNPKRENIALKPWLASFYEDFLPQSNLKPSQLTLFVEPPNIEVSFDPAHLHQIIWNLSRNAVKYAKEDVTQLQLLIQASIPNYTRDIILSVIDNGDGLSPEQKEHLFEPFFTTSTQGTGLGLFMSRELCQANGASLEYSELTNGGSCFRISFTRV